MNALLALAVVLGQQLGRVYPLGQIVEASIALPAGQAQYARFPQGFEHGADLIGRAPEPVDLLGGAMPLEVSAAQWSPRPDLGEEVVDGLALFMSPGDALVPDRSVPVDAVPRAGPGSAPG